MAISENSIRVIKFLQAHANDDLTSADVAEALGLEKKTVDGVFTSAIQRKGLGVRVPAEVEDPDTGLHTSVKLLKLNADGMAFTGESDVAAD